MPGSELVALSQAGKLSEALSWLEKHPTSTWVDFYNLGTVHHQLGHSARAVAYLTQADRLSGGREPDVRANLELARESLTHTLGEGRLDPASDPIEQLGTFVPSIELAAIGSILAFVLTLAWVGRKIGAWAPLTAMGIAAAFLGIDFWSERHQPAVVLEAQVVRSGPGDPFIEMARLVPGTQVRLLGPARETDGATWRQIRYSTGAPQGWVRASAVLALAPRLP